MNDFQLGFGPPENFAVSWVWKQYSHPKTTLSCSVHRVPCSQSRPLKAISSSSTSSQKSALINTILISARKSGNCQPLALVIFIIPSSLQRAEEEPVMCCPSYQSPAKKKKFALKRYFPVRYYCISNVFPSRRKKMKLIWKQREESVATLAEDRVYKSAQEYSKSTIRETSDKEKCVLATCLIVISMKNWNHTSMGLSFPHSPEGGSC